MNTLPLWQAFTGITLWFGSQYALALAPEENAIRLHSETMQTKDLEVDENGFLRNIGSDAYFFFRNLSVRKDLACAIKMDMEFAEPMPRPGLFEVFWHGSVGGFSESQKAFFIINQKDSEKRQEFIIPLCKLFHYSGNINNPNLQSMLEGLRIDYPSNKEIGINFHSIELIDATRMMNAFSSESVGIMVLEPYERLHPNPATSLDVLVPKLFFIFEEGLARFWKDKWFFFFWLLMIVGLKILILKSFFKKRSSP